MFLFYYFIYLGRRSGDKKEENVLRVWTQPQIRMSLFHELFFFLSDNTTRYCEVFLHIKYIPNFLSKIV